MTARRVAFGSVDKLPSGRHRARYVGADGLRQTAPVTFATEKAARKWLASVETDMARGVWIDPQSGAVALADYAAAWLNSRLTSRGTPLRPRVRELYGSLLRLHINPTFGDTPLSGIKTPAVRGWYTSLVGPAGPGASTAAKAYRLMRAILATAVVDDMIVKNPCTIDGAGVEHAPERPLLTPEQASAVIEALPARYKIMALLGAYLGLRRGEIFGLTRRDIDLLHGTLTVRRQRQQMTNGAHLVDDPKTEAGKRTLFIPAPLARHLELHLAEYAAPGVDGPLMVGEKGGPLRICVWSKHWAAARSVAGLPELHLHDLRHFADTVVARSGVTTKELMAFMGHASPMAALHYQHATTEGAQAIADAMGRLMASTEAAEVTAVTSLPRS